MQGPYPWDNLDAWLINKFITGDLQVNKAGEPTWMKLKDMMERVRMEKEAAAATGSAGKTTPIMPPPPPRGGGHPPGPPPTLVDARSHGGGHTAAGFASAGQPAGGGSQKPGHAGATSGATSHGEAGDGSGANRQPLVSRYLETVDQRVARMLRQGKFGAQLTRLATGKTQEEMARNQTGSFLDSPRGGGGDGGGDGRGGEKRKATTPPTAAAPPAKKPAEKKEPAVAAAPPSRQRQKGYEQLPVFEPERPVPIPLEGAAEARDPREKPPAVDGSSAATMDLPLPDWGVEEERQRVMKEAAKAAEKDGGGRQPGGGQGFDEGGPRPAAGTKAEDNGDDGDYVRDTARDDSDDEGSDVSWSALPGTREPLELVETRKRQREEEKAREAALRAEEERASAAAAHAAAAAGGGGGGGNRTADPADPESAAEDARLAALARDPSGGLWHVPDARDAWKWTRGGYTRQELEMELGGNGMPDSIVATRQDDDRWQILTSSFAPGGGREAYGEVLRGETLARRADKEKKSARDAGAGGTAQGGRKITGAGAALLKKMAASAAAAAAVEAVKRETDEDVRSWFDEATADVHVDTPPPAEAPQGALPGAEDRAPDEKDDDEDDAEMKKHAEQLAAKRADVDQELPAAISAWFDDVTKDVVVPEREKKPSEAAVKKEGAAAVKVEAVDDVKEDDRSPIVMRPSSGQVGASARLMGEMFNAIMKNRKRLFYELVEEPLNDWLDDRDRR